MAMTSALWFLAFAGAMVLLLIIVTILISIGVGIGIANSRSKNNDDDDTPRYYMLTYHAVYQPTNMPESESIGIKNEYCSLHCLSTDGPLDYGKAIAALMVRHKATFIIIANVDQIKQKQIIHLEGPPLVI
jgi:hypothetical protein